MLLFLFIVLLPTQLGFHFWPSWSFVSGRPIDYLSPTVYLTDLIIILLLTLNFNKLYYHIKKFLIIHWKLVVLVSIGIIFNTAFSHSIPVTIFSWLRFLVYFSFGILLFINHKSLINIQLPLILGTIWTSILTILQFINQNSLGGLWYWLGERSLQITNPNVAKIVIDGELVLRPYATFGHPNALAGFLLVSYWLIKNKVIKLVIATSLLLTFSRTAIVIFIILNIISIKNNYVKAFSVLIFGIVICLGFRYSNLEFNPASIFERILLVETATKLILASPISGVGLGSFISALATNSVIILQPVHNIYLLLISELGIVLVSILGFILIRFKNYFEFRYSNFEFSILSILLTGMLDHYWLTSHQNRLLLVLVIVLCLNPKKLSSA